MTSVAPVPKEVPRPRRATTNKDSLVTPNKQEDAAPRYILIPTSTFRRNWDICIMIFLIYNASMIPFRIAFDIEATGG